jgi:hypothetical protein
MEMLRWERGPGKVWSAPLCMLLFLLFVAAVAVWLWVKEQGDA